MWFYFHDDLSTNWAHPYIGTYRLGAVADEDSTFSHWEVNGEYYSDIDEIEITLDDEDLEVVAIFNRNPIGEIVIVDDGTNFGGATIETPIDELIGLIELDKFEEEEMLKGLDLSIYLEVYDISDEVSEEDKKLIQEKLGDNTVGIYLDINLYKQLTRAFPMPISETAEPITISFELPENLRNNDKNVTRTFKIIRIHNGEVSIIDAEVKDNIVTFKTNGFSTYALVYKDIKEEVNPKTGDNVMSYAMVGVISLISLVAMSLYIKKEIR